MRLGVLDRCCRDGQGEEEVGECQLPGRLPARLLGGVGGPLEAPHRGERNEQEPADPADIDEGVVAERRHLSEVGEGAVGDRDADQAGDEEHERPVPTATALGQDAYADSCHDHVAYRVGETDRLGEDAAGAGVVDAAESRRPAHDQERAGHDDAVQGRTGAEAPVRGWPGTAEPRPRREAARRGTRHRRLRGTRRRRAWRSCTR